MVELTCRAHEVCLNDKSMPFTRSEYAPIEIRLFLDRSIAEAFIDYCACLTLVLPLVHNAYRIELVCDGSSAIVKQLD